MSNEKRKKLNESSETKTEMKVAHFKVCPGCRSSKLVKFDMDFFCMDCDWNSVLFDVHSGNFEKRIGIMNRRRTRTRKAPQGAGVIHLADLLTISPPSPSDVTNPFQRSAGK